jgi:hypothetical protein
VPYLLEFNLSHYIFKLGVLLPVSFSLSYLSKVRNYISTKDESLNFLPKKIAFGRYFGWVGATKARNDFEEAEIEA